MLKKLIYIPFVNILIALIAFTPGHSAALAIIVFTLIIRLALLIPNRHALESQKKIQALQPEIDKVRSTYKDQQEQAKALMELYQKNKISPFGSCLPMLIQLPILIILYRILQAGFGEETLSQLYSFVPRPEYINNNFFGIDLSVPDTTLVLPILAAGFQLLQTFLMTLMGRKKGQKVPGQSMFFLFSILTFVIAKQVNAGVAIYWITSTIFGIGQQFAVNRSKTEVIPTKAIDLPKPHHHQGAIIKEEKSKKRGIEITVRRPGEK